MSEPNSSRNDNSSAEPDATQAFDAPGSAAELVRVLDQYMSDLHAGRAPNRDNLLAEHPDLAGQLQSCLASIEFIHGVSRTPAETPAQLGDFRIVGEIGRGGMGVVYEAQQLSLKRRVALKVLRFGGATDPEAMQRFQTEAETVAHLHHTNIVPIFAVGQEHGVNYYAMQFIEGRGLDAVFHESQRQSQPLDAKQVARWGLQAAEALTHAHERRVIHRDIKPSNLLLDENGTLWLTDFGLAKRIDEVTMTVAGAILGTPRYMSPEQADTVTRPVDHRTDIYSLGASLYELATGQPVFTADTPLAVLRQIKDAEPQPPRTLRRDLPRDLETVILKCLSKDAGQRYQSAKDLADDLRAVTEGRAIKARRPNIVERSLRWAKKQRRSAVVAVVASAAAIVVALLGVFWWNEYRESQLARLRFTTEKGQHLTAELIDRETGREVARLTVPNEEELRVPAGRYQVRASSPGKFDRTLQLDLSPRESRAHTITLPTDKLWSISVDPSSFTFSYAVDLAGRHDVVLMNNTNLSRRHGSTGEVIWETSLGDGLQALLPDTWSGNHWPAMLAVDINDDKTRDLLFVGTSSAAVVAISGKTGQTLWHYRSRTIPEGVDPSHVEQYYAVGNPTSLGQPALAKVAGQPALITVFADGGAHIVGSKINGIAVAPNIIRVEALRLADGERLWRHDIDRPFGSRANSPTALSVMQTAGHEVLAVALGPLVFTLGVDTGKPAGPMRDLGFVPAAEPQWVDLAGDASPELLTISAQDQTPTVLALSLASDKPLWTRSLDGIRLPVTDTNTGRHEPARRPYSWPLAADVDADGHVEVLVPWYSPAGQGPRVMEGWFGLEMLDGTTGRPRWQRRLFRGPSTMATYQTSQVDHFIVGPDLDGDGNHEIFTAAIHLVPDNSLVYFDALSGVDGQSLWSREERFGVNYGRFELTWGPRGRDGFPLFVAHLINQGAGGGATTTYLIRSSGGAIDHTLTDLPLPQVADLDGDGLDDLLFGQPGSQISEVFAVRGTTPVHWERLITGHGYTPAGDLDGDGAGDLLTLDGSAVSSRDGQKLWKAADSWGEARIVPPLPQGDLNGDGVADVIALAAGSRSQLIVTNGRDGSTMWKTDLPIEAPRGYGSIHWLIAHFGLDDLDGDGRPDVLLVCDSIQARTGLRSGTWRAMRISAADGRVVWSQQLKPGEGSNDANNTPLGIGDLDGDGTLDVVLLLQRTANTERGFEKWFELHAMRGSDGKALWKRRLLDKCDMSGSGQQAPSPQICDLDGDGTAEVLVTDVASGSDARYAEVLALSGADGQVKWSWRGDDGQRINWLDHWRVASPRVVRLANGPAVLVSIHDSNLRIGATPPSNVPPTMDLDDLAKQIVLLDAGGNVLMRLGVQDGLHSGRGERHEFWVCDLEGDGRDEVLLIANGTLRAYEGDLTKIRWEWPFPESGATFLEMLSAAGDRPATVVMRAASQVVGIDVTTGTPVWRWDAGENWSGEMRLLARADGSVPLIWFFPADRSAWRCAAALPIDKDGRYILAAQQPRKYDASAFDPRLLRPLPWHRQYGIGFGFWELLILLGVYYGALRPIRRWKLIAVAVTIVLVSALTAGVWLWIDSRGMLDAERYAPDQWYFVVLHGFSAVSFVLLVVLAMRLLMALVRWTARRLRPQSNV